MRRCAPLFMISLSLLSACATYTTEYQQRLTQSLPDKNGVVFSNTATYPGRVLCGEYTARHWNGFGTVTRPFVVAQRRTLNNPNDTQRAVYCSRDPVAALFDARGIGGPEMDRVTLARIRDDMRAIDAAILVFYKARNYAPRVLAQLLDGDFGVTAEQLEDPWGRPYLFEAGLAGRSLPRYDLATLGRNGEPGGSGPDADIDSEIIDLVGHVLDISEG